MGVLEVMELFSECVMCSTCVCLHIKPLKLSPEMASRPMFYTLIPPETHTGSNARSNGMFSVIGYTSPKICFDWVSRASDIIKIKAEKGFQAYVSPNYTM